LSRQGLGIQPIEGDGNCLFRSILHQVCTHNPSIPPFLPPPRWSSLSSLYSRHRAMHRKFILPPSLPVYGTEESHLLIREKCMDYMHIECEYLEPYVVG